MSAVDEHGVRRVLPELLVPILPPSSMQSASQVARMVRCVTWALDDADKAGGSIAAASGRVHGKPAAKAEREVAATRGEVWRSLPWLVDVQRGGVEEHALLMASLLIGMQLDAYVCVGRLRGSRPGQRRHAWVLVREPDGAVVFWELSTGRRAVLPARWAGKPLRLPSPAKRPPPNRGRSRSPRSRSRSPARAATARSATSLRRPMGACTTAGGFPIATRGTATTSERVVAAPPHPAAQMRTKTPNQPKTKTKRVFVSVCVCDCAFF